MECDNNSITIALSLKVGRVFMKYKNEFDYANEAGGILIGRIDGHKIIIEDLTEPFEQDKRSRYSFKRATKGHQTYMDKVWKESGETCTYLGEWHTHDQERISPSCIDCRNWEKIMFRNHNVDILVFIILGRVDLAAWVGVGGKLTRIKEVEWYENNKTNSQ